MPILSAAVASIILSGVHISAKWLPAPTVPRLLESKGDGRSIP